MPDPEKHPRSDTTCGMPRAFRADLMSVLTRTTRDASADDADARSEAILQTLQNPPENDKNLDAWLKRKQQWQKLRAARQQRRRRQVEMERGVPNEGGEAPLDAMVRREDCERVVAELGEADDVTKRLIVLRYFEGLSVKVAAGLVGVPYGTALSKIHRFVQRLQAALGR